MLRSPDRTLALSAHLWLHAIVSGLVVDRLQHRLGPSAAIVAAPALRLLVVLVLVEVVHAEAARGVRVEQTRSRAEARWRPVLSAALIRRHERTVGLRLLRRVGNRLALRVHALRPVRLDVLAAEDVPAVGAIEHEEPAVAARLREQLARLPVDLAVDEHRRLRRVPVVRVVRRRLEVPRQLPRVRIERDDRLGEEIVALPLAAVDHRLRVSGAEVDQIQIGVVCRRPPGHAAAVRGRFIGRPRSWPPAYPAPDRCTSATDARRSRDRATRCSRGCRDRRRSRRR